MTTTNRGLDLMSTVDALILLGRLTRQAFDSGDMEAFDRLVSARMRIGYSVRLDELRPMLQELVRRIVYGATD